jgi:hypothetical protein
MWKSIWFNALSSLCVSFLSILCVSFLNMYYFLSLLSFRGASTTVLLLFLCVGIYAHRLTVYHCRTKAARLVRGCHLCRFSENIGHVLNQLPSPSIRGCATEIMRCDRPQQMKIFFILFDPFVAL